MAEIRTTIRQRRFVPTTIMNDQAKLNFFASNPEPCSYLSGRKSISAFANPHVDMDMETYNVLIQHGFRRSGGYIYRPHCPLCEECVSVRVLVNQHRPSRNDRRVIRRNSDLSIRSLPGRYRAQDFDLYRRYINSRHGDGNMANPTREDYHRFLICDWANTIFFEFRLNRIVVAVLVCDIVSNGLSAVYSFFDPDHDIRSLGHFAILSQIEETRSRGLDYLYLGYWIRDSNKMRYKQRYQPLERYVGDHWQAFDTT